MLYRDVERTLETGMTLSVEQQHSIIPILEKEVQVIPLDFYVSNDGAYINLYICGSAGTKLSGILSLYKPETKGDCLLVKISAEEMRTASVVMDEISKIPSVVRGGLYMKGNKIYVDYRLPSSTRDDITNVWKRITDMKNRTRISELAPSAGGISLIDSVDSRIHLGVVSYEASIAEDLGLGSSEECYIEYNFNNRTENGLRGIVYDSHCNFSVRFMKSDFIDDVQILSEERRIPNAGILARLHEGKYISSTFIPYSMIDDHLSVLHKAAESHKETNFKLLAVKSYDRSVWDWV